MGRVVAEGSHPGEEVNRRLDRRRVVVGELSGGIAVRRELLLLQFGIERLPLTGERVGPAYAAGKDARTHAP